MSWVKDFASSLVKPVSDLISEVVEDKDKANELAHRVATMAAEHSHAQTLAQLEINKIEAKHSSVFVAGGRPAAIWVGVTGLALEVIVFPTAEAACSLFGYPFVRPDFDTVMLLTVLLPLLGIGGYRTIEKLNGRARDNLVQPSK